jgi:hypothetical protein
MAALKRQNAVLATRLRTAALTLATDENLCAMFGLTPEQLAPYRGDIDSARAVGMASLKHQRYKAQATRARSVTVKE